MKKLFFLTLISTCSFSLYAQIPDSTRVDTIRLTAEDSKIKIKDDKVKMKDEEGKLKVKDGTDMNVDGDAKTKIKDDKAKMKDDEGKIKIKDANDMSAEGESKTKIKRNKRKHKDADGKVKVKGEGAMSSDMNTPTSNSSTISSGTNTNTTTVNIRTTTEVFPDKPASLPKVGGNVPAEVVTTLKNKYGATLYDIKQVKSSSGQIIYVVRLFDNGGMRSEYVGADGVVVVQ